MSTSIHHVQIKEYWNINGEMFFVWSCNISQNRQSLKTDKGVVVIKKNDSIEVWNQN